MTSMVEHETTYNTIHYLQMQTSIRGASYVIILSKDNGKYNKIIHYDKPKITFDKIKEILYRLYMIEDSIDDCEYYLHEYRTDDAYDTYYLT